jgi:MFS family permease
MATSPKDHRTIFLYSGTMAVALYFVSPAVGAFIIPFSFILKNKLHFTANGLALFGFWASVPGYLCFLFGMIRDFWNPFGLKDRGYFILFGATAAALYTLAAFVPASAGTMFVTSLLTTVSYLFLWAAWNGLASTIARQHDMSGQISAVFNLAGTASTIGALALGGVLSDALEAMPTALAVRSLFLIAAVAMSAIAVLGLLKPRAVFGAHSESAGDRRSILADLGRLIWHRPVYPALAIWLLWNFSPASQTPLQYYLSDVLHASDRDWGAYNSLLAAAAIPSFILFGFLSRKFSLGTLIWVGAIIGVPQMVPLLFVHTTNGVLATAVVAGFLGGMATGAFFDLLMRACPASLEGSLMMLAWGMYSLSTSVGNVWGTALYEHGGGFFVCIIATTLCYAAILPLILLVPQSLLVKADEAAV